MNAQARPIAIAIVAAFLFAATVIAVIVGVSLLFPGPLLDRLWDLNPAAQKAFRALGRVSGYLLLLVAAVTLSAAVGLCRRKRWAWWIAVTLFAVNGTGDVVSLIATGDWVRSAVGIAVAGLFLCVLLQTRREFAA